MFKKVTIFLQYLSMLSMKRKSTATSYKSFHPLQIMKHWHILCHNTSKNVRPSSDVCLQLQQDENDLIFAITLNKLQEKLQSILWICDCWFPHFRIRCDQVYIIPKQKNKHFPWSAWLITNKRFFKPFWRHNAKGAATSWFQRNNETSLCLMAKSSPNWGVWKKIQEKCIDNEKFHQVPLGSFI